MVLPEGFPPDLPAGTYVRLLKGLYGLKQASRVWHRMMDRVLRAFGMTPSEAEPCLYTLKADDGSVLFMIAVYVDDFFVAYRSVSTLESFLSHCNREFKLKDLGDISWALGINVVSGPTSIKLDQQQYIKSILNEFNMMDARQVQSPEQDGLYLSKSDCPQTDDAKLAMADIPYGRLVGKLLYLSGCTRPDIAAAVRHLSRFLSNPGKPHWTAAKRVLSYLAGTMGRGITYRQSASAMLSCWSDADWASTPDDRKSISGFVTFLCGGPLSWASKTQTTVAASSTESEYVALSEASREVAWLRQLLPDLNLPQPSPTVMYEDNKQTIGIVLNPEHHARNKHMDVRLHFVRHKATEGQVRVEYVPTDLNTADIMTKPLGPLVFKRHRDNLV